MHRLIFKEMDMDKVVRWGILGPGGIAHKFADALKRTQGCTIAAVGSRGLDRAKAFAKEFDIPRYYGSYEELAGDKEIDVIYVASPHNYHCDNTLLCLNSGKGVLCEKPMAVSAQEASRMIDTARKRKLFLMEAMWTRFLPTIVHVRKLLAENAIGEVRMLSADFGFRGDPDETKRILNPMLAGGALLDVGVYPLALASMVLGKAEKIASAAHIGRTGVDEQAGIVLSYSAGKLAIIIAACTTETPHEAAIMGTTGMIRIAKGWWRGGAVTLQRPGREDEVFQPETAENGFVYEIEEVHRLLKAGKTESPTMSLGETLTIAQTMDEIRCQWGMKYPFEA
jgi:dihydrodiol dehydrogenase / D-xylose 1-dehydrogenase (NADP)